MKNLGLSALGTIVLLLALGPRPIHAQDGPDLPVLFELEGGISISLPEGWLIDTTLAPSFALIVSDEAVLDAREALPNEQAIILTVAPSFYDGPERAARDALVDYDPQYGIAPDTVTAAATTIDGFPAAITNTIQLPIPDSADVFLLRAAAVRIGSLDLLLLRVAVDSADEAQFEAIVNSVQIDDAVLATAVVTGIGVQAGDLFDYQAVVARDLTGLPGDLQIDVPTNWRVDVRDGTIMVGSSLAFLDLLAEGTVANATEQVGAGLNIVPYALYVFPEALRTPQALMDELVGQVADSNTETIQFGEQTEVLALGGYGVQQPYTSPAGTGVLTLLLIDDAFFVQINALVAPDDADALEQLNTILLNMAWVAPATAE